MQSVPAAEKPSLTIHWLDLGTVNKYLSGNSKGFARFLLFLRVSLCSCSSINCL